MHITDWFSSAWLNAVGQKSTSIVSDGLIGHFDPESPMSFNGIGTTFFNLVDVQSAYQNPVMLDMTLVNGAASNWFSPTEQRPLGLPSYFDLDGTDDYIGPAVLDYGYGPELNSFYVDGTEDFTISFWIRPRSIAEGGVEGVASLGNFVYNSISLGTTPQGHYGVAWPKTPYSLPLVPVWGAPYVPEIDFRIAGPSLIQNPSPNQYKKENSNNLNFEDWQYIAITKKTNGPYGPGDSKITFYINGIECGLMGSTDYQEFGDAMPTITIQANLQIPGGFSNGRELYLYLGGVYLDLRGFCTELADGDPECQTTNHVVCSSNSFGLILVYNRALKRNELRQNFLATRTTHRYYSPGRGYHQDE